MLQLDFYFDFGSPTAFLAYRRLLQLEAQYALQINHVPMLLGAVFKNTGNASPVTIPAKGKYMLLHDLPRFARRYGVDLKFNPKFPFNTLSLMRGAYAAVELGCFDAYARCVFDAVWAREKNMGDHERVLATLEDAGLPGDDLLTLAQSDAVKKQLIDATDGAVARGVFGAPTMFIGEDMYFGQDRLDFVEEALQRQS